MSRRTGLSVAGMVLILVAGIGGWRTLHATYGNPTGFHVVDGYWLGPETSCSDANAPDYCPAALATATAALDTQGSHAQIVRAMIAPENCSGSTLVPCTNGGMGTRTLFVVFDLADGSRHPVGLLCQGAFSVNDQPPSAPNCYAENISNEDVGTPSGS